MCIVQDLKTHYLQYSSSAQVNLDYFLSYVFSSTYDVEQFSLGKLLVFLELWVFEFTMKLKLQVSSKESVYKFSEKFSRNVSPFSFLLYCILFDNSKT